MDKQRRLRPAEFFPVFGQDHRHVIADGLGQAGSRDPDQFGRIFGGDVLQAEFQVSAAAIDRVLLAQRRRGDIDRLVEVANDIAPHIGGAALGAMQKGDAAFDAAESDGGPERFAEFAGVGGGGEIGHLFAHDLFSLILRGTNFQTGLMTEP
ncbi:MAG: hypothetical protein ACD_75C02588G0002 [uncultured bacterium]|nr:MAG: hypothetical protein ACD_75C02588G0002 [uncultured bacterium]